MPGLPDILPSPMKLSQPSAGTGRAEPCLGAEEPPASGHALDSSRAGRLGSQSVAQQLVSQVCLPGHLPPLQPRRAAEELVELDEERRAGDVPPLLPLQGGTSSPGRCGRAGGENAAAESL